MPPSDRCQDAAGAMASAQRDALLELVSVLAHDLNNPLQTLLVLSELALDESPAGTEANDRARQCLAAADRLKVLTQAMGGALRGRPQDLPQLWARAQVMLGRRLERYGVTVQSQLGGLGNTTFGGDAEWAVLLAVLAVIGTAATSNMRRHELELVGELDGNDPKLVLALTAIDSEGARHPLAFQPQALARLCDAVPGTSVDREGERVRLLLVRAA